MRVAYTDVYLLELPRGHRFPMEKYRLSRERLLDEGTLRPEQLLAPGLCSRQQLERVHTPAYVARAFEGRLAAAEVRRLGFPWSPALVRRSRASVAGTVQAALAALEEGVGGNLAGGTHHAHADRGEGFCVFNDVAVTIAHLRALGRAHRAAVVDCDVHQGDGTASIFRDSPEVFTVSLHGRNNWPHAKERSDLDIALDDGTADTEYLGRLEEALEAVLRFRPEIIFYIAGADPLLHDRLGRLSLTLEGLRRRDERVLATARDSRIPVALCMGGGYAEPIDLTVEVHANTFRVAVELFRDYLPATM